MNRVELYTPAGAYRGSFSVAIMVPGKADHDDGRLPEETYFRKVLFDASGNILLLGGSRSPHPGRDVFLCDRKGALLGTFVLPSRSRLIALGERGALYCRPTRQEQLSEDTLSGTRLLTEESPTSSLPCENSSGHIPRKSSASFSDWS